MAKKYMKGVNALIYGILGFIFTLGLTIYALGTLNNNINESSTNTFFTSILTKLTSTTGIIGAVVIIALIGLMFVAVPFLNRG